MEFMCVDGNSDGCLRPGGVGGCATTTMHSMKSMRNTQRVYSVGSALSQVKITIHVGQPWA